MNKSLVLPFKAISEAFVCWIDSAGESTAGLRGRIVSPDIVRLTEDENGDFAVQTAAIRNFDRIRITENRIDGKLTPIFSGKHIELVLRPAPVTAVTMASYQGSDAMTAEQSSARDESLQRERQQKGRERTVRDERAAERSDEHCIEQRNSGDEAHHGARHIARPPTPQEMQREYNPCGERGEQQQ